MRAISFSSTLFVIPTTIMWMFLLWDSWASGIVCSFMKSDPPSVITIAMSRTFRLSPYLELNCMVLIARRALYVLVPSCKVSRSIVLILNSTNYYISCSRLYREILLVIKEHIEHYLSNLEIRFYMIIPKTVTSMRLLLLDTNVMVFQRWNCFS